MSTRDLPKSISGVATGWIRHLDDEVTFRRKTPAQLREEAEDDAPKKTKFKNLYPAFVSGAGLFSDGYINNSISTVSTCLARIYGDAYTESNALANVSSIAFVGIIVGQLSFGYISDRIDRKAGMLIATAALAIFSVLIAVATWGAHGSPEGLFAAIAVFRFFVGVALGAEYPTASVIASEFANQLPAGHRNRYFGLFTNTMIDFGFVVSAFVPLVLLWIFSDRHLQPVWRLTLGLGAVCPTILFFLRMKIANSDSFKKTNMKRVKRLPIVLILKFYWFRLFIVSFIWFLYNFSVYSFGIYSSYIFSQIIPTNADGQADLYRTFGWNVVFNLFYMPGSILGSFSTDYFGPRLTLVIGVLCQAVIGFSMAGSYDTLKNNIAGFIVVYGIFSSFGEFGPGVNVGLLASKTTATPVRGITYAIAAATGKIGGYVGTWVFPTIIARTDGVKAPFFISSSLCVLSAFLALFFLPSVGQDAIYKEDEAFLSYLESNGFDLSQLGDDSERAASVDEKVVEVVDTEKK